MSMQKNLFENEGKSACNSWWYANLRQDSITGVHQCILSSFHQCILSSWNWCILSNRFIRHNPRVIATRQQQHAPTPHLRLCETINFETKRWKSPILVLVIRVTTSPFLIGRTTIVQVMFFILAVKDVWGLEEVKYIPVTPYIVIRHE